jgi:hypothetical protein
MPHIRQWVQTSEYHDATEDYLPDDAEHQQERQTHKSRIPRANEERRKCCRNDARCNDSGEKSVELLDGRMGRGNINESFFVARRPIDATQP